MTTLILNSKVTFHAAVVKVGNCAFGAYVRAAAYAAEHGTDGYIPDAIADLIANKGIWEELVDAGLVVDHGVTLRGFEIVGFLALNPSAKQVIREQKKADRILAAAKHEATKKKSALARAPSVKKVAAPPPPEPPPPPKDEGAFELEPSPPPAPKKKRAPAAPRVIEGDYALLIDAYHKRFMERRGGAKPIITARTGKAARDMLAVMPLADAIACVEAAFEDDWFARTSGELFTIAANPNRFRRAVPPPMHVFRAPPREEEERPEERTPEERAKIEEAIALFDRVVESKVMYG